MDVMHLVLAEETLRLRVYDDATGKPITPGMTVQGHPTIGYGRNLCAGISPLEALTLFANDLTAATDGVTRALPFFTRLSPVRQAVLISMALTLGLSGLLAFHATLRAIAAGQYATAAAHMRRSQWAARTGERATRLAAMMEHDRLPDPRA
jgi:lysozyme